MRWKQELIGASVALAVTVIGGVIVYAVTQRPEVDHREQLSYQIDRSVSFSGKDRSVSIGSLRFSNAGDLAAKEVVATIKTPEAQILEFTATRDAGPNPTVTIAPDKYSATVVLPNLLPGDVVHATYLTDKAARVKFDLRSNASIGKPRSALEEGAQRDVKKTRINILIGKLLPALLIAALFTLYMARQLSIRVKSRGENRNNNAFVLMHTGHYKDALEILSVAVQSGENGAYAMANYAGAAALDGQLEEADKFIGAAEFLAGTPHETAIVKLNKSVIAFCRGGKEEAVEFIREALESSKREIRDYYKHSLVLKRMAQWEPLIGQSLEGRS